MSARVCRCHPDHDCPHVEEALNARQDVDDERADWIAEREERAARWAS